MFLFWKDFCLVQKSRLAFFFFLSRCCFQDVLSLALVPVRNLIPLYLLFCKQYGLFPLAAFKIFSLSSVLNNLITVMFPSCFLCLRFIELGSVGLQSSSIQKVFSHYSIKYFSAFLSTQLPVQQAILSCPTVH